MQVSAESEVLCAIERESSSTCVHFGPFSFSLYDTRHDTRQTTIGHEERETSMETNKQAMIYVNQ